MQNYNFTSTENHANVILPDVLHSAIQKKSWKKKDLVLCFVVKEVICQSVRNKKLYNCENWSYLQIW